MADIELVIKIDENEFNNLIKRAHENIHALSHVDKMILHGIPLPKGHGRLIDADELDITTVTTDDYSGNEVLDVVLKDDIDEAPTIIEADRSVEDGNDD